MRGTSRSSSSRAACTVISSRTDVCTSGHSCACTRVHACKYTHTHTHTRGCQWLLIHNGAGSGACIERESLYLEGTRSVKRCGPIRRDDAISSGATCCPASRVMERRKRGIGVRRLGERSLHLFIRRTGRTDGHSESDLAAGPPAAEQSGYLLLLCRHAKDARQSSSSSSSRSPPLSSL